MKKLIALLVMVMSLGFSSLGLCSPASNTLDKEEQVMAALVKVVSGEADLKTLEADLTPGMKKNFNAEAVKSAQKGVTDTFGKLSNMRLYLLRKEEKADVLIFFTDAKKVPNAQLEAVFDVSGKKPLLNSFLMAPTDVQKLRQAARERAEKARQQAQNQKAQQTK
jgi:hypothetical protein